MILRKSEHTSKSILNDFKVFSKKDLETSTTAKITFLGVEKKTFQGQTKPVIQVELDDGSSKKKYEFMGNDCLKFCEIFSKNNETPFKGRIDCDDVEKIIDGKQVKCRFINVTELKEVTLKLESPKEDDDFGDFDFPEDKK
jgi:hypothetical protein